MNTLLAMLLVAFLPTTGRQDESAILQRFRSEFVSITPGKGKFPASYLRGSREGSQAERPAATVSFDYSFEVSRYEVTQELWEVVMGTNPSRWKGPRNSVEMVSYPECLEFCKKLTRRLRELKLIQPQQQVRLPTEAEWEYVAAAGTRTQYSFGDSVDDLADYAWFTGNAAGNDPPVGAKRPNPWGLYDVHGYLWEWCLDVGTPDYRDAPRDGSPHDGGPRQQETRLTRVIRGGSWKDSAEFLRTRCRQGALPHRNAAGQAVVLRFQGGIPPETKDDAIGLRCVLAQPRDSN